MGGGSAEACAAGNSPAVSDLRNSRFNRAAKPQDLLV